MPNLETESLLRERIDDLSTQLLIAVQDGEAPGRAATFSAALAELARHAADAGYCEAARIAAGLSAALPAASQLQDGLARLERALSPGPGDRGGTSPSSRSHRVFPPSRATPSLSPISSSNRASI